MRRRTMRAAGCLVAGVVGLAGCGSNDGDEATEEAPSPTDTGTHVVAELTEYAITLPETSFAPGTYTFVAREDGQVSHALTISGPGVDTESTEVLNPGDDDALLTVELEPGTYELWCPVGNHAGLGMKTSITVR
jgi:plastocyanin